MFLAADYSLNNPDTLTKYKDAARISESVLAAVTKLCVAGEKIVDICEKGDKLIEEELEKVYRGKKITKGELLSEAPAALSAAPRSGNHLHGLPLGFAHPTTVSPASFITPYTPLKSDEADAALELQPGEPVKIQLGAQIDGFGAIVCDTILVSPKDKTPETVTGRPADLILATHYANELLLRLMVPAGLLAAEEDKAKAPKAPSQSKITSLLEKVAKSYECSLVESTTSWLFDRNEIEGKKKIVIAPSEGSKGEGTPDVGEVWGVEMGLSLGTGKAKVLDH